MKRYIVLVLLAALFQVTAAQEFSIENALYDLPDVIFKKIETPEGFSSAWELRVKQPIDHQDPSKGYFYQKAYLSNLEPDQPMVIVTEGYEQNQNIVYELTHLLQANQVIVEHRYFGESIPEPEDYQYLTLEQETADLHHINQLLHQIYKGKWISTGISKGGQTTIYYRYFYPADVSVSVPYVAPFNLKLEEDRIYNFLDTVGTRACRNKIRAFQKRILRNRDKVLPMLHWYSLGAGYHYTYLSFEQAFEYTVLEYSFSFWQWGHSCGEIPPASASLEQDVRHLLQVSDIGFFSDDQIKKYGSHYYQAATQMGYYGYRTDDFKKLLKALPVNSHPLATFVPDKMKVHYNDSLARKVFNWIETEGNHFIYIYGGSDTWSATAVPPTTNTDALWFFLPGKGHGGARIRNMSAANRQKLEEKLSQWLNTTIDDTDFNNRYLQ